MKTKSVVKLLNKTFVAFVFVGASQVNAGELNLDQIKWNGGWNLHNQDSTNHRIWLIKTQLDLVDKKNQKPTGLDPSVVSQNELKEQERLLMFARDRFEGKSAITGGVSKIVGMEFVKAESFVRETVDGPLVKKLQGHVIIHSVGLNDVEIKSKTYTIDSNRSDTNFMFLTNGPEELILEQIDMAPGQMGKSKH